MYKSLSESQGQPQYPGHSFFIPSLMELKEKYGLQPHVVIQNMGDLIAAGPNTYHVVICEVSWYTMYTEEPFDTLESLR